MKISCKKCFLSNNPSAYAKEVHLVKIHNHETCGPQEVTILPVVMKLSPTFLALCVMSYFLPVAFTVRIDSFRVI